MTDIRVTCRLCGERPAAPSRVKSHDYRCKRCINRTPNGAARLARYNASAGRQSAQRRANAKRIHVGDAYHSTARTADEAARINAHIKARVAGFESSRRAAASGGERDA